MQYLVVQAMSRLQIAHADQVSTVRLIASLVRIAQTPFTDDSFHLTSARKGVKALIINERGKPVKVKITHAWSIEKNGIEQQICDDCLIKNNTMKNISQ